MKKLVSILISVIVFYLFFIVLVKSTNFKGEQVYIQYNNEGLSQFADSLVAKKIIFEKSSFLLLANVFKVEDRIKPGKFLIKRKTNLIDLIRMFRNNRQATVKLVLNKVRTKGEFAKLIKTFIHGYLHLLGFDHIKDKDYKRMLSEEEKIYKSVILKIN